MLARKRPAAAAATDADRLTTVPVKASTRAALAGFAGKVEDPRGKRLGELSYDEAILLLLRFARGRESEAYNLAGKE
jgi:hypothetical protein